MKMDEVAGSGNDEFYTPLYAVKPIFKYLKSNSLIWCPFDTDESYFVKYGKQLGHQVVNTHLNMGWDFFNTKLSQTPDYIISNPPIPEKQKSYRGCLR